MSRCFLCEGTGSLLDFCGCCTSKCPACAGTGETPPSATVHIFLDYSDGHYSFREARAPGSETIEVSFNKYARWKELRDKYLELQKELLAMDNAQQEER